MSQVFFDQLNILSPKYNLNVGSGQHGEMTGAMLERIEPVLLKEEPDWVLVYGDTNSTLAGALSAAKLHIPVAHVEAGLRSYNRRMPEEINRVLTDHISTLLFCPTLAAVENLRIEGITGGVYQVGDVMFDAFLFAKKEAAKNSAILSDLKLRRKKYCLATVHREENTKDPLTVRLILKAFEKISSDNNPVIVPIHPRTKKIIDGFGGNSCLNPNVHIIPSVGYFDMIILENNAKVILTDSGGMQKEAFFAQVPCITLRDETEWLETVECGANFLTGSDVDATVAAFDKALATDVQAVNGIYGDGNAAEKIIDILIAVC
jgi:UDP-GlcNAc3NAcA epimerase